MENQKELKKTLLEASSDLSYQTNQKIEPKINPKRLRRSKSAPLIVSLPRDLIDDNLNSNPTSESIFKKLHPSCKRITTFLTIYLLIGALCFYLVRDQLRGTKTTNSILDAFYLCIVTMTTVGYGDLIPRTTLAKLLTCALVFSGMALVVLVLSQGADYIIEKQEALVKKALQKRRKLRTNKLRTNEILNEIETSTVRQKCIVVGLSLIVIIICGTMFLILVEKLDAIDAFYCVCVTMTSLGFGDYSFSSEIGRCFAVVWILLSTICMAQLLLYLAELSAERKQNKLVKWVLARRMTVVDLEAADMDNDGFVVAAEFVLYKLKEMGKVTQNDISRVMKEFEELDVDQSGTLSVYDLERSANY